MALNRQTYTDNGKKSTTEKPKTQSVSVGGRSINVPTSTPKTPTTKQNVTVSGRDIKVDVPTPKYAQNKPTTKTVTNPTVGGRTITSKNAPVVSNNVDLTPSIRQNNRIQEPAKPNVQYKQDYTEKDVKKISNDFQDKLINSPFTNPDVEYTGQNYQQFDQDIKNKQAELSVARGKVALNKELQDLNKEGDLSLNDVVQDVNGKTQLIDYTSQIAQKEEENKHLQAELKELESQASSQPLNKIGAINTGNIGTRMKEIRDILSRNEAELSDLTRKSKYQNAVYSQFAYEDAVNKGDTETLMAIADQHASYDDSFIERRLNNIGKTAVDVVSTAVNVAQIGLDLGGEAIANAWTKGAEELKNSGTISDEQFNNMMETVKPLMDYDANSGIGAELRNISAQLSYDIQNGVDTSTIQGKIESFIGQGLDSTVNFLAQYMLFGEAGSLALMSGQSGSEKYFENIEKGYDQATAFANALATGMTSYFVEKIGMDNFVSILNGQVGNNVFAQAWNAIASGKSPLKFWAGATLSQGLSEGLEEGVEGTADYLIDLYTSRFEGEEPAEYNAGDIFYGMLVGAFSGALTGSVASFNVAVNTRKQYNALKVDVDSLISARDEARAKGEDVTLANRAIAVGQSMLRDFEGNSVAMAVDLAEDMAEPNLNEQGVKDSLTTILEPNVNQDIETQTKTTKLINDVMETAQTVLATKGINMDVNEYVDLSPEARINTSQVQEYANKLRANVMFSTSVDGDGFYDPNLKMIVINPNSKLGELSTLVHELTHGTEASGVFYDSLASLVKDNFDGNYNKAIQNIKQYYKSNGVKLNNDGAKREFTAINTQDMLGNEDFVKKLIRYNESLAYRIFSDIRNMFSSDIKTNLENAFMQAYKANTTVNQGSLAFSQGLNPNDLAGGIDNFGKKLSEGQKKFFDGDKLVNEDGNLLRLFHTSKSLFSIFDPTGTKYYRYGKNIVNFFSTNKEVSGSYASDYDEITDAEYFKNHENLQAKANELKDKATKAYKEYAETEERLYRQLRDTVNNSNAIDVAKEISERIKENDAIFDPTSSESREMGPLVLGYGTGFNYELRDDLNRLLDTIQGTKNPLSKVDSIKELKELVNTREFRDGKIVSEVADLLSPILNVDTTQMESEYKTYDEETARLRKIHDKISEEYLKADDLAKQEGGKQYVGYGMAKNPYVFENESGIIPNWNELNDGDWSIADYDFEYLANNIADSIARSSDEEIIDNTRTKIATGVFLLKNVDGPIASYLMENPIALANYSVLMEELGKQLRIGHETRESIAEKIRNGQNDIGAQNFIEHDDGQRSFKGRLETNDVVKAVLAINEVSDTPYDGVVFKNITDSGGFGGYDVPESDIVALFNSNQFKLIGNENPTESEDIQYSKNMTPEMLKLDLEYEEAVSNNDTETMQRLVNEYAEEYARATGQKVFEGFHGTNARFNEFLKEKLGSKNFLAESAKLGFFMSGSKETAENYTGINDGDFFKLWNNPEANNRRVKVREKYNIDELEAQDKEGRDQYFKDAWEKELASDSENADIIRNLNSKLADKLKDYEKEAIKETVYDWWHRDNVERLNEEFEATEEHKAFNNIASEASEELNKEYEKMLGYDPNIKHLFAFMRDPLVHDFKREGRDVDFSELMKKAIENGNDGNIFYNVQDGGDFDTIYAVFEPNQFKSADPVTYDDDGNVIPLRERFNQNTNDLRYSKGMTPSQLSENRTNNSDGTISGEVTDQETIDFLENQDHVKVYRAMAMVDGKLVPPMSVKVKNQETGKWELRSPSEIGKWYRSEERPDLIKGGKYNLKKDAGTDVPASYNPYFHTSLSVLNDQFSGAYARPNLVVVEGEVPASELTSGYQAPYAKDSVGKTEWHSGTVSSQLKAQGKNAREVILTRWFKPVRVLSDTEVATGIRDMLAGTDVEIPFNVVTPGVRTELEKMGVPIGDSVGLKEKLSKDSVQYSKGVSPQDLLADAEEFRATIAPYFDTRLNEDNRDELIKMAEKAYDGVAKEIADYLGIKLTPKAENIGGFENDEGKRLRELSWTYDLKGVDSDTARLFTSLMGDLAFENQEAVICLRYLSEDEGQHIAGEEGPDGGTYGKEYGFKYKDLKTVEEALKKADIANYNIDRKTNYLTVQDFGFDDSLPEKLDILLEGNNYETKEERPIYSYYLSREARQSLYEARGITEGGLQEGNQSGLSGRISEANKRVTDVIEKKKSGSESPFLRRPEVSEYQRRVESEGDLNMTEEELDKYQGIKTVSSQKYGKKNIDKETGILRPKAIVELDSTIGKTTHEEEIKDGEEYAGKFAQELDNGADVDDLLQKLMSNELQNGIVRAYYVSQVLADRDMQSEYMELAQWARDIGNLGGKLVESNKILYDLDSTFSRAVYLTQVEENLKDEYKQRLKGSKGASVEQTISELFNKYANDIINSKTNREFRSAIGALAREVNRRMPKTIWDRITQFRMLAMLSGSKTIVSNAVSNIASVGLYRMNSVNQALLESALQDVTIKTVDDTKNFKINQEDRRATLKKDSKVSKRNREIAKEVWKTLDKGNETKYGIDPEKIPDIIKKNLKTENDKVRSKASKFVDAMFETAQSAQAFVLSDAPFARMAFVQKFDELARARGINLETIDKKSKVYNRLIDDAFAYAEEVVSHNETDISKTIANITRASASNVRINEDSTLVGLDKAIKRFKERANNGEPIYQFIDKTVSKLQKWFIPFYKTNASIFQKSLQYSPLEWVQVANDWSKVKAGKMEMVDMVEHMAKAVTGSQLYLLGAIFGFMGWLKWEKDDEDYSGRLSIRIPGTDKGYTVDFIDPVSTIFAKGVVLAQEGAENGVSFKALENLVHDYEDIFLSDELDMFSSMKDFFDTVGKVRKGEDDYGEYTLGDGATDIAFSVLNSYIPAIVRDVSRMIDPAKKVVYDSDNKKYLLNRLINSTPFRANLVDKKDSTGRTINYTQPFTGNDVFDRLLTQMVSRGKLVDSEGKSVTTRSGSPTMQESSSNAFSQMAKDFQYNDENGDGFSDSHWIRDSVPSNIYPGGNATELTPEEKDEYGTTWTKVWNAGANYLVDNDTYKGLNYENQADVIYELQGFARECIEADYCKAHDIEMTEAQRTANEIRNFCTVNGKVDGKMLGLIALGTAKENKLASGGQRYVMAEQDENGKTIRNSRQLAMRHIYEEAGIYEQIIKAVQDSDGALTYADFGLGKTVVESYSDDKADSDYQKIYNKVMKNSKSSKSKSKKITGGSAGGINKAKGGGTLAKIKGPSAMASPVRDTKIANSFFKAYANTFNRKGSSEVSTASGGQVVCPRCGNRVSSKSGRCPICGASL